MPPPKTTALGALLTHITGGHLSNDDIEQESPRSFQPMNINYGLLPAAEVPERDESGKRIKGKEKGFAKKRAASLRALADLEVWLASQRGAQAAAE